MLVDGIDGGGVVAVAPVLDSTSETRRYSECDAVDSNASTAVANAYRSNSAEARILDAN